MLHVYIQVYIQVYVRRITSLLALNSFVIYRNNDIENDWGQYFAVIFT